MTTELRIGPHRPANPVVVAPMSGVTDLVFRRLAVRFGAGWAVSEMVASGELAAGSEEARLRAEGEGMALHVVQLAGREARAMAEGARVAEASGADVIDINMGCPAKKVTGGYSGAALLKDLDHALTLIDATVAAVKVPVTLKMRLGWDRSAIVAPELAARAEAAGVVLLTVHGRTRDEFYEGQADWPAIAEVKARTALPVIANGDVTEPEHATAILRMSGADGVMIGRGAQGRPWFPGQAAAWLTRGERLPDPSLGEQLEIAREHYHGLLSLYGEAVGVRHARKHLGWYLDTAARTAGAPVDPARRTAVMTAPNARQAEAALVDAYDSLGWRVAA